MIKLESVDVYKKIMGSYPTGIAIITTFDEENNPIGLTVNSFASVSLDPLLVLWSLDKKSSHLDAFKKAKGFAVHILAVEQGDLCWAFAGKNEDRFADANWTRSDNDLPVIADTLGVMECQTFKSIEAGDHVIFIGQIIEIEKHDKEPLLYFRRNVGGIPAGWPD